MNLKELIKVNKIKKDDYISFYNKDNIRFYGTFVNSPDIQEYLEYEAELMDNKIKLKNIWLIRLPIYKEVLGLNSIRYKEERRKTNEGKK